MMRDNFLFGTKGYWRNKKQLMRECGVSESTIRSVNCESFKNDTQFQNYFIKLLEREVYKNG